MTTLHIFHTNDFHNHFSDAHAEFVAQKRGEFANSLLVDAGDAISAGNIGVRPGGEPILTRMSLVGYDAMTMGNREFHVADALLRMKIANATFPILCANIRWRDDHGAALPLIPSISRVMPDGLRVSIFGLTVPMVTVRMAARVVSAFLFDDPVAVAQKQIDSLRSSSDILIALTHIGLREDERLARACPTLDLVIGGHSHNVLESPIVVNGVPIVQGGWFGHYLGHVALAMQNNRAIIQTSELISMKDLSRR